MHVHVALNPHVLGDHHLIIPPVHVQDAGVQGKADRVRRVLGKRRDRVGVHGHVIIREGRRAAEHPRHLHHPQESVAAVLLQALLLHKPHRIPRRRAVHHRRHHGRVRQRPIHLVIAQGGVDRVQQLGLVNGQDLHVVLHRGVGHEGRQEAEHVERHHVGVGVPAQPRKVGEHRLARPVRHFRGLDLVHPPPV